MNFITTVPRRLTTKDGTPLNYITDQNLITGKTSGINTYSPVAGLPKQSEDLLAWGDDMVERMRPATHCGVPTTPGETRCLLCSTSFVE